MRSFLISSWFNMTVTVNWKYLLYFWLMKFVALIQSNRFFCFFLVFFFSFYHNKIHRVTNYIAIKNKIYKTRQHGTNKQTNKKNNKKSNKKENKLKIHANRPPPFSFWTKYQSIIWSIRCHFFNNLSFLELVNSFSISLIFLIFIFKLSKLNCLVFLVL